MKYRETRDKHETEGNENEHNARARAKICFRFVSGCCFFRPFLRCGIIQKKRTIPVVVRAYTSSVSGT